MLPAHSSLTWQAQLAQAISDPVQLVNVLQLDPDFIPAAIQASQAFPLRVPHSFVERMEIGKIDDPLLRQVLPLGIELEPSSGYSQDPLKEKTFNPIPGLLHKYQSRVLLTVTGACAVNCRYCFRRDFPYEANLPGTAGWERALNYIASDPSINEVIFSGGDPLAASDSYLAKLSQKIALIEHVETLRIHTRMPIMIPSRITDEFLQWFTQTRLQPVLVVHSNHPQELDASVGQVVAKLRQAGVTVLNQSVLLKGINDAPEILIALSKALFKIGILPYYLHLLDKVQGAAHFDVSEAYAKQLHSQLARQLPGYLVPKLVREEAGAPAKSRVS